MTQGEVQETHFAGDDCPGGHIEPAYGSEGNPDAKMVGRNYFGTRTGTEAEAEGKRETPTGNRHLHLMLLKGRWDWVVRDGKRKTTLCDTPRCRPIVILEYRPDGTAEG